MTYRGHVKNGQIALDMPISLPEGSVVTVEVIEASRSSAPVPIRPPRQFIPIELPGGPLSDDIVHDRR